MPTPFPQTWRILPAMFAGLILLAGCDRTPQNEMILSDHETAPQNFQQEALAVFDALCATQAFAPQDCACMRDRMAPAGARAMAYAGAVYGGDLARAALLEADMDAAARQDAVEAWFAAQSACLGRAPQTPVGAAPLAAGDAPDFPATTLDEVRASCRPALAEVCVCRARAMRDAIGEGGFAVAEAINRGDRARLAQLAAGREPGWADMAGDEYARTNAPCILRAGAG